MKCKYCKAPVDYTENGIIRFDSSQYHIDAVKRLSEISCLRGEIKDAFEMGWLDARHGTDESHQWLHENATEAWETYQDDIEAEAMASVKGAISNAISSTE